MKLSAKNTLLGLAISIFTCGFLFSCKDGNKNNQAPKAANTVAEEGKATTGQSALIAYVDLDTLEVKYEFWQKKKAEFETRQKNMEAELDRMGRNFQSQMEEFQRKAQAGSYTQSEGEAAQRKLADLQQSLEKKHESMTNQLLKEQQDFNKDLQTRLDNYLAEFNKYKKYAYILSYSKGTGSILYADPNMDITNEVIEGLNASNSASKN